MDMREITPVYHVSPQISVEDVAEIKEAGIRLVICNRPDEEVAPDQQADAIGAAVEAAGLDFARLPLTHRTMNAENVSRQSELIAGAEGKVLAYCASGTRCTVVWALGHVGTLGVDDTLSAAAQAGYDLSGMRPTLEALSKV
ncbi:TIGR01244 family sulfur transferase [Pseudoponticoccus marisrubri]|uniref:Beta-lactamase hydrolase-like protein phosphatase-like domain-containing protein n=1 Tax=Pseudoponticoccus marisrubri TaxID=1685382 RepID=A0A0W7WI49_9RHOB|nr:TIGR01244 family sulfur transferase [Pseudoponticoccus marisrubri]KUF10293.1 hypothetical protein AVJ23_12865 [Pseudoponticoccus marisrubri]